MNTIIQILVLISFFQSVICYLDHNKIKYAINSGYSYYYKDKQKIMFRFVILQTKNNQQDQQYQGGRELQHQIEKKTQLDQWQYLLPFKFIDNTIYLTERTILKDDKENNFYYEIPIRIPGDYCLIFCLMESSYNKEDKRKFNIIIENYVFKIDYDIYHESGGDNIPIYEIVEFSFKNNMIRINNSEIMEISENKLTIQIDFKGEEPKINGLMLYQGNINTQPQQWIYKMLQFQKDKQIKNTKILMISYRLFTIKRSNMLTQFKIKNKLVMCKMYRILNYQKRKDQKIPKSISISCNKVFRVVRGNQSAKPKQQAIFKKGIKLLRCSWRYNEKRKLRQPLLSNF